MHTVKVILNKQLSTPNFPNEIHVITQAIVHAANKLGTQYHCNLNHHIAAALHRDPDTLITNVYQNDIHDMVSVRLIDVDPNKSDSTTTRYRVSACFFFKVYHHNASDTLNAVVW